MDLSHYSLSLLRAGDLTLYRGSRDGGASALLLTAESTSLVCSKRLEQEYALKGELDATWAARPLALSRYDGRLTLVLEDPGGEPLERLLGKPLDPTVFLQIAVQIVGALRRVHERGLIHKDIKPANVLVEVGSGGAWLTGFGLASRLPREYPNPDPREVIAGSLPYMAPEQTGRMNRSIDARSDLYSLGITFYEMLTGVLPFTATDPLEWIHCHIARQPTPPNKRVATVPAQLSAIVVKLLAKTPEDRYQTASGVEADLRTCSAQWESCGRIAPFPLGAQDACDRLVIPEKLYGRETEINALLAAFDRLVTQGTAQLVLVSGGAGIGKSSVVNELHKAFLPSRGLFAAGKFDQYKRDIPYASLGQAFQSLVSALLGQSEAELRRWRDALCEALGPNGQLVVNLIPELELIIGIQPPLVDLAPQEAKHRFQLVFRRFVGVFARKQHPLVLFLDDLQWLDVATLDLLEDLLSRMELQHLMLIGAYRDDEVYAAHPLMRWFEAIGRAGAIAQEIRLGPLPIEVLGKLLADCLQRELADVMSLAQLMHEKTAGNPFFAVQFISSLAEEGLLTFDHSAARWSWDMTRISAKGYSDNVADLMVGKLKRLPPETVRALQQLACLGNNADIDQLRAVYEDSYEIHRDLRQAVQSGLVLPSERAYRFLHDRVQEAAYSSIQDGVRGAEHLRIGRVLAARITPKEIEDRIFEIVGQLNRGRHLITSAEEQERVAELNLIAGRRAKSAIAYASALRYFSAGRALLAEGTWQRQYRLMFDLELNRAQCEFLTGEASLAEEHLASLAARTTNRSDLADVILIQVSLYTHLGDSLRAVEICLGYLRQLGVIWSSHPTDEEICREYERLRLNIGARSIESLIDLPPMTDSELCTVARIMTALAVPAGIVDLSLMDLVVLRLANLSLEHGNTHESCIAYVHVTQVLGPRFGDYRTGYKFGQLSIDLIDKAGLNRFKTSVFAAFAQVGSFWGRPIRESYALARRASEVALEGGDLTYSSYAWFTRVTDRLACGDPLDEVQAEAERGLAFTRKAQFKLAINLIEMQLRIIRVLRGLTPNFGSFNDNEFDEARHELYLEENPLLGHATLRYWALKLQARFYAEDYASAVAATVKAESMAELKVPSFETAEYYFYAALSRAGSFATSSIDQNPQQFSALIAHHRQLVLWAEDCPANFLNRAALVGAEIARLEGRELDAERLYEEAIRSARENGFIQNEGLAHELAARFYAARGFQTISNAYLKNARGCYVRWGADGKVRQMDLKYPQLVLDVARRGSESTLGTPVEQLDLTTVVKVSHAVSGEIEINRLIATLMQTALENAGAERGMLILPQRGEMWIEAEASTAGDAVEVHRPKIRVAPSALPESILNYVVRTRDSVLLNDAIAQEPFSRDEYVRRNTSRSVLCLPLVKQTRLIGVLYLENRLVSHVFTPARIAILRLLASQAATSLENARLYSELRDAHAVHAQAERVSSTGSFCWRVDTDEITLSEELYRILDFAKDAPVTLERIANRVHPEDIPLLTEKIALARSGGGDLEYEIRLRMPDNSVKYLRSNALVIRDQDGRMECVGAVQDATQYRLSEEALSRARSELAQVSRVTSLGALTASIAHEVTQPLAAIVSNADSCLMWLAKEQPNLDRAKRAAARIAKDGLRAGNVIESIRALARKAPPELVTLDINQLIADTLDLLRSLFQQNGVSLETRLLASRGFLKGERTQLQQVIVNLVTNGLEAISASTGSSRVLRVITESAANGDTLISVEDSGSGIDVQIIDRIFEPMFTTKAQGMGLGLSICRSIVEGHGGRLWALPNPTGGSIFRFNIPGGTTTASVRGAT